MLAQPAGTFISAKLPAHPGAESKDLPRATRIRAWPPVPHAAHEEDPTPARKRRSHVYLRGRRYWGDFRDYITVGGKLEALVPPGDHLATTDLEVANKLAGERLQELERRKRGKDLFGIQVQTTLREYAAHHLMEKARAGKRSPRSG
jgi:hypothetical protein